MNILQLCLRVPFPPREGGSMAMKSLTDGLQAHGHKVDILALNTTKHYVSEKQLAPWKENYSIKTFDIDNKIKVHQALVNLLFSKESFHISRFYSEEICRQWQGIVEEGTYDAIIFESLFMAPYIQDLRKKTSVPMVLRSHNVESRIWERVLENETNVFKSWYLAKQLKRLKKYEQDKSSVFDLVASISPLDMEYYQSKSAAVIHTPFGIGVEEKRKANSSSPFVIGFIGSLDWKPNQQGLEWFMANVWPQLNSENLRLRVAGKNMPIEWKDRKEKGVEFLGEVEDSKSFMRASDVLVVPLHAGSGIRIKILEAMSLGVPVLTTTIGLEGIKARPNNEVLIANQVKDFVQEIKELQHNPEKLERVGNGGYDLVANNYSTKSAVRELSTWLENNNS